MTLAFLDLESTGLNPLKDRILEIGFIVTDDDLNEVARRAWVLPRAGYADLDPFIQKMHGPEGSKLLDECVAVWEEARQDVFVRSAGEIGLFLREHLGTSKPPLCGSSVDFDRSFLRASGTFSPLLDLFHYRVIDVSTIKETARRWAPGVLESCPKPRLIHRVLPDLEDTLAEARHYKKCLFS